MKNLLVTIFYFLSIFLYLQVGHSQTQDEIFQQVQSLQTRIIENYNISVLPNHKFRERDRSYLHELNNINQMLSDLEGPVFVPWADPDRDWTLMITVVFDRHIPESDPFNPRFELNVSSYGRVFTNLQGLVQYIRDNYPAQESGEAIEMARRYRIMSQFIEASIQRLRRNHDTYLTSCEYSWFQCSLEQNHIDAREYENIVRSLLHIEIRFEQGIENRNDMNIGSGDFLEGSRIGPRAPEEMPDINDEISERFEQLFE